MRRRRTGAGAPGPVAGVVLAGGGSRRFGRDKLAVHYRGAPLLHHPVLRLLEVCEEVIVVIAPDAEEPAMPAGAAVRFARDPHEGEGPLAGAVVGLEAAGTEWVVLAGGDMPDLQAPMLREMLRTAREANAAVALAEGGKARPLPCVLDVGTALGVARDLLRTGRRSLKELLAAMPLLVVDEPTWTALDPERRTLLDVDEPTDLDR